MADHALPRATLSAPATREELRNIEPMLTFDLHFHANIHRMPTRSKALRLRKIRRHLRQCGPDFLASTEHSYKKPLEAYQRLSEATADLRTTVIPGVEAVSSEGIDIIFLFDDEAGLRRGLGEVRTFGWSVRDVARIAAETGALTIVPHPFHLGRTSAGNILSRRAYLRLLAMSDYVEIHNGSALTFDSQLTGCGAGQFFCKTQHKLDLTLDLPLADRGEGLGWAVSSDAHYPGEQFIVGSTDAFMAPGEPVLDFLRRRIRFAPHALVQPPTEHSVNSLHLLRSLQGVLKEAMVKQCLRTSGRARAAALALALSCSTFPSV